jgi:hypothetical protein
MLAGLVSLAPFEPSASAGTATCTVTGGATCSMLSHAHSPYHAVVRVSQPSTVATLTVRHPSSPTLSDRHVVIDPNQIVADSCSATVTTCGQTVSCQGQGDLTYCKANPSEGHVACSSSYVTGYFQLVVDGIDC